MEQLHGGYTLYICPGGFPLSTDSMALAGFIRLPKNARVLDLGSGCGTLGLLLCAKDPGCSVTGIELDTAAHEAACRNIENNSLHGRLASICTDLRQYAADAGSFHCCVSNPPYFSGGPQSATVPIARRDDQCTIEDLFRAASRHLRYGGDFFLVHRPEKLAALCAWGAKYNLEAKRLQLLRHRENGPVALILLQFRKGGKPGLQWEEVSLHHADGTPTEYYRKLYHMEES